MNTNFSRLQECVDDKFATYECETIELKNRIIYLENKSRKSRSKSNRTSAPPIGEDEYGLTARPV